MKYVITIIICLLLSYNSQAEQHTKLLVVTEHWPPFNYKLPDNSIGGIATKRVIEILNRAEIDFEIQLYPWARAYHLAQSQRNVLIYSIYRNKEREKFFHWICPILPTTELFLFTLSNSRIQANDIDELKKYTIGIVRKEVASIYLKAKGFKEGDNLFVSTNDDINLKALINRKIDFIIGTVPSMTARLRAIGKDFSTLRKIRFAGINENTEHCMALSLATPQHIVKKLQHATLVK